YMEFDGVMVYDLKAEPLKGAMRGPIERLHLAIPVKAAHALYYYTTGGGWSPAYGHVPPAGEPGRPFWTTRNLGDFVPYLGLTDDERAIQWFADNDHDWVLGEDAPCAQLVREGDVVEAQIHLVRRKGVVPAFAAKFGFIAAPIKPLPKHWRYTCLHFAKIADSKLNFFYGPSHGGCFIDPHDTAKLAKVMQVDVKGKNPDAVPRDLPAGTVKWNREDYEHVKKTFNFQAWETVHVMAGWDKDKSPHKVRNCYFFNASMYFEGYRSKAFSTFFPGEWQLDPPSGWFHLTPVESYQDFFSFHMDLWMKHWFVPGLYFDEVYLGPDHNVFNGNGKVMPDGTVRSSVPLMQQRRFLNRMRQLFLNHGRTPFLWVHTSNYMAPHAISAADVAMFGEDRQPTPMTDIMDTVPGLLLRSIGRSQKFGFLPLWMVQQGRGGSQWAFAGRQTFGWFWIHDVVPEYHTVYRGRPLIALRAGWGIDEPDAGFLPYWNPAGRYRTNDPKFIASAWTRPGGKVMLMVMNMHYAHEGKTKGTLTLNPAALGLAERYAVYDLESDPIVVDWLAKAARVDALERENRDNETRKKLLTGLGDIDRTVKYDLSRLKRIAAGPTVKLTVPARDFKVLVIEPAK
ncbi:MAG TPA: hypothetical protein VMZ50_11370, partial [Phycisphaerae bacterium]|nr:hypothetical protein [Phycisphaerae bacterium]